MTKHQKHTNLVRRNNDNYAYNEVAVLGTKCNVISELVAKVSQQIINYKLAYFDASHAKDVTPNLVSEFIFHHQGNLQVTTSSNLNKYQQRIDFSQHDFVFINGNHYQGAKQVLVLDETKEASVLKRLEQLNNIEFVIKLNEQTAYFDFLQERYPEITEKPCYLIDEIDKISNHFLSLIEAKKATLKGLVLMGGKSIRMGQDKANLEYYGKPQKEVVKSLLQDEKLEVFYSVQNAEKSNEIGDKFYQLGPFGGICSAFLNDPNAAWLVLATDLPFVNKELIHLLISKRNTAKVATAIKGKNKQFVEPLITIYEPKAYPILLQYLAQGYSCPRKMLINSDVEIIEVDDRLIRNVNTPEEFKAAKNEIEASL